MVELQAYSIFLLGARLICPRRELGLARCLPASLPLPRPPPLPSLPPPKSDSGVRFTPNPNAARHSLSLTLLAPSLFSFLSVLYWPLCVMFLLGTPTRSLAHFALLPPLLPTTETKAERESGRVGVESSPLFMNETRPPFSLYFIRR